MSLQCMAPQPSLGAALGLADYLDCQSRALGENGFQALTGGPVMAAVLSGLVTIFIALIGYRMILGSTPDLRDGVGWAVRLGVVLALVTSWPAFQTLIYRAVTDGPEELAALILPAAGLSQDNMNARIEYAYERMRAGSPGAHAAPQNAGDTQQSTSTSTTPPQPSTTTGAPGSAPQQPPAPPAPLGTPAAPLAGSMFVASTAGLIAALRIVVGFLVAVGPLLLLGLLFPGASGLVAGWLRALIGAAFGVLAATITTTIELVAMEAELVHEQAVLMGVDPASSLDPQALTTIALVFVVIALAAVAAAVRLAGAIKLPTRTDAAWSPRGASMGRRTQPALDPVRSDLAGSGREAGGAPGRARTAAVADALTAAAYRDQGLRAAQGAGDGAPRSMTIRQEGGAVAAAPVVPLGVAGRRSAARRTQSARRRDLAV